MNTKFKFKGKTALVICAFSTTVLLPLATPAQNLPRSADDMQGMHMRMESPAHHQSMAGSPDVRYCRHSNDDLASMPAIGHDNAEAGAGFSETDPASHVAAGKPNRLRLTGLRMRQPLVGFTESDPAARAPMDGLVISRMSMDGMHQPHEPQAGFSETDPTHGPYLRVMDIQNRGHEVCLHDYGERVVPGMPGFHGTKGNG